MLCWSSITKELEETCSQFESYISLESQWCQLEITIKLLFCRENMKDVRVRLS